MLFCLSSVFVWNRLGFSQLFNLSGRVPVKILSKQYQNRLILVPLAKAFPKKIFLAYLLTKNGKACVGTSLSKALTASEQHVQVLLAGSCALSGAEVDLCGMLSPWRSKLKLTLNPTITKQSWIAVQGRQCTLCKWNFCIV